MQPYGLGLRALVAVAVVLSAAKASGSLLLALDLSELTAQADRVVVANVVSVRSEWDASHQRILSRIELQVEEAWKGEVAGNGRLTVVQPGGTADDLEMTVHGMPRFKVGERNVLFLSGATRASVVGMAQGQRALRWDSQARRWMAHPGAHSGLIRRDGSPASPATALPLDELRERVRALVER